MGVEVGMRGGTKDDAEVNGMEEGKKERGALWSRTAKEQTAVLGHSLVC